MPANLKYLTTSPWQQFAKISSGLIGGYSISALLHMCIALIIPYKKEVLVTSIFSMFLIWGTLLVLPFLFKNAWKAWLYYIVAILSLYLTYHFLQINTPII